MYYCGNEDGWNSIYKSQSDFPLLVTINFIGDGNGDGVTNAQDLIILRQALLTDSEYSEVLDANGDGVVDIRDLVRLKKHLANGTPLGKQNTPAQNSQPVPEIANLPENKQIT